jgi:hypothetical protein
MDQYGKMRHHHIENTLYTPYNRSLLQVVFTLLFEADSNFGGGST